MATVRPSAAEIFDEAIRRTPGKDRAAYLDEACAGDAELYDRVQRLLVAFAEAGSFLESPAADIEATTGSSIAERPGTVLGPYKLLQQIGEGGFGVVFLAEQERPVRRRVALKVVKPGMDTRQVISRFEAERQALAIMHHPNIAKVYDAGTTETGRPYFVMELVQGVPITEYCDQCNLTTRERLELFITVCQAVQHAHQMGVIHRDIKPSNVLVAIQDGEPAPKIIDFGVAKAIGQRLTEHTLLTAFAQIVGTPLYMSPEQAELSPLGVDTRSDIYSLGVLLYELLTGVTPFDKDRLHRASYDELRRIIREQEPPRPSARISTLAADLATTVAKYRRTDARHLSQLVRGELDWIVMKCLEKDRNRRYETPNSLARDIERFLHDEPVQACPPSTAYRLKKFFRRNKMAVLGTGAVVALLVALVVTLALTNARIRRESDARAAALKAKEASLATTRQAVQQLSDLETDIAERLTEIPGGEQIYRAMKEDTLRRLEPILKQAEIDGETTYESFVILETVADIQCEFGRYEDARRTAQRGIDVVQKKLDAEPDNFVYLSDMCRAKSCLVRIMSHTLTPENEGRYVDFCNELLDLKRDLIRRRPERTEPTASLFEGLGNVALRHGDRDTAKRLYREAIALAKSHIGQKHSQSLARESACRMAIALGDLLARDSAADADEISAMFEQALQWAQGGLNVSRSRVLRDLAANAKLRLGLFRFEQGRIEEAIPLVQHAAAESRGLRLDFPLCLQYLETALWAQDALIRLLKQSERADESKEAEREMAGLLDGAQSLLAKAEGTSASHGAMEVYDGQWAQLRAGTKPEDTLAIAARYAALAYYFASAHREKEAADFVRKAVVNAERRTDPAATATALYHVALMQLRLEDETGYRATCKALVDLSFDSTNYVTDARPIWTPCLAPDALDDLSRHVKRAEEYLAKTPQGGRHFGLYLLGAAQFRVGQFEQAVQSLEESIAAFPSGSAPATHTITYPRLLLAMCKWQLGQKDDARRRLTETLPAVDKELQSLSLSWNRRVTLELLRGEAEALIQETEVTEAVENVESHSAPTTNSQQNLSHE
jgi:serine/threonine protein kinase/tetratricopeptide (TPR) repeat protein